MDLYRARGCAGELIDSDLADSSDEIGAVDLGLLVRQLPPDLGEAIELRYGQCLKVKEVALILGVSRFSAMRTIDRALRALRNALRPEEEAGKQ